MRIGIITSYLSGGGAGLHALELSEKLTDLGHEVHILTEKSQNGDFFQNTNRVTVDSFKPFFSPLLVKLFQIDPWSLYECTRFLRRYRFDIIHIHEFLNMSFAPILAADICHIPVVATIHTYWPVCFLNRLCYHVNNVCKGYNRKECSLCLAERFAERFRIRIIYRLQQAVKLS